ncbi:MAG: endonuclease/exonuclease/phosphatase family protein [Clostridium sp.]|uniref:endonuclease/exonuclease/phosphatase family protein n=1 Tax=Clostridium sp. TaxID=1506 RepID=UPI003F31F9A3
MKLLTLNCHSWREDNQIEKIKYLAKVIKEKEYDVIALQEVSQKIGIEKNNFCNILIEELTNIGAGMYNYIWDFSHIGYDIYEEGLAILTRHKIKESSSFYVSKNKDYKFYKSRKIVEAIISINNCDIQFLSCHLGWWNDESESFTHQVDKLYEHVRNDCSSFIMGDFNNDAFIENEGYDYLLKKPLYDTYNLAVIKDSGITVEGKIDGWKDCSSSKRLDLILTNKKSYVERSEVIFNNKNKEIVSDHYGVEIEL